MEALLLPINFNTDYWLVIRSILNIKGPELLIFLYDIFVESSSNQSFDVIDGVCWVPRRLVFCSLPNQPLAISKCNIAWSDVMTHIVLNDVHLVFSPHTDT